MPRLHRQVRRRLRSGAMSDARLAVGVTPVSEPPSHAGTLMVAASARATPTGTSTAAGLPSAPVFDWASLRGAPAAGLPSVDELPHRAFTTSEHGRLRGARYALAALFEIKNRRRAAPAGCETVAAASGAFAAALGAAGASADDMMRQCDMARTGDAPLYVPATLPGDVGPLWSRHVMQLPCRQDLSKTDVTRTARTLLDLLSTGAVAVPGRA